LYETSYAHFVISASAGSYELQFIMSGPL
jgi:hypothetical protein